MVASRLKHLNTGIRNWLATRRPALLWLCLLAPLLGQYLLDRRQAVPLAAGLLAVGALGFAALVGARPIQAPAEPPATTSRHVSPVLVSAAVILGALAFPRFGSNLFTASGTALWCLAVALLLWAAWRSDAPHRAAAPPPQWPWRREGLTVTWQQVTLAGIVLLGAFFRLYRLAEIPLEMGCDLPHNYANIRLILRGEYPVFFSSYPGREALFFYMAAPVARLFGLSHLTIKLASALVGLVTLPVIYLLGKELYSREVGLYAAFFMSISHWHVILTRVGFRASTVPLLLTLVWWAIARGRKTERRWFFALAGLFLSLGLYTYNAFMIAPLMAGLMLLGCVARGGRQGRLSRLQNALLVAIVALIVFVPLGRYAFEEPQQYFYRAATRITDIEAALPQDLAATLLHNIVRTALMFNYQGDIVFIANVPLLRQLGWGTAALFVLGCALTLARLRRGLNGTLWVALGVMVLPTTLSLAFPHEVPNATRAIGALPAAMLLPAVALAAARRELALLYPPAPARVLGLSLSINQQPRWQLRWPWAAGWRHVGVALMVVALGHEAWATYPLYFRDYVTHLPDQNYSISLSMARLIDDFSDDGDAYIKVWPYWHDGNAVRAQLRRTDQSWNNEIERFDPAQPPLAGNSGKFMVILHPDDREGLALLRQAFPRGIILTQSKPSGDLAMTIFYGER
jgi:4-amino-4-deoxy-L-arabinose transferase-like glycosyltransferase